MPHLVQRQSVPEALPRIFSYLQPSVLRDAYEKRTMAIDDSAAIRQVVALKLKGAGIEVIQAVVG